MGDKIPRCAKMFMSQTLFQTKCLRKFIEKKNFSSRTVYSEFRNIYYEFEPSSCVFVKQFKFMSPLVNSLSCVNSYTVHHYNNFLNAYIFTAYFLK